jgi:hypothetical protein
MCLTDDFCIFFFENQLKLKIIKQSYKLIFWILYRKNNVLGKKGDDEEDIRFRILWKFHGDLFIVTG